jgi:hypothetical protein
MSSTLSPDKFEARKALIEAKSKLVALVGTERTDEIVRQAESEASSGGEVDEIALAAAVERAYDKEVNVDPRTHGTKVSTM